MPSHELLQQIEDALRRCVAAREPHRLWVGFSGGVDSTALLLAASRTAAVEITAVHVNHGLDAAAAVWSTHCAKVCARLGITLEIVEVKVAAAGNLEANARQARYEAFAERVGQHELLLLGHHADDQLETVLQRLFRGRGLLPMREHGSVGGGEFARPLLGASRAQLAAYVEARGESWIEDPSNADTRFERNYLRRSVVPVLEARWQRLGDAVLRVARDHQSQTAALGAAVAAQGPRVPLTALPVSLAARRAWLRAFLEANGAFGIADRGLDAFLDDLHAGRQAALACPAGEVRVWRETLYFIQPLPVVADLPAGALLYAGASLALAHGTLRLESCTADAPDAIACEKLRVQFRRGGEALARGDRRIDLSDAFAAAQVPPWWRDSHPLLYAGERLAVVPGVAVASAGADLGAGTAWRVVWTPSDPAAVPSLQA